MYECTFSFLVSRWVYCCFTSLSVPFSSSSFPSVLCQAEILSCKYGEIKWTNIIWPIKKVIRDSLQALKSTTQCECIDLKQREGDNDFSSYTILLRYSQSWVIIHANWPGKYEILRTPKSHFSYYLYSYLTWYKQAFCNFNIIFKRRSNTAVVSDMVAVLEHHEMVGILVKAYLAVADPDL